MKANSRYKEFNKYMETVLKNARFKGEKKDKNIKDYELVFVPIIWARHFYVVCFNIKHESVNVLDNSGAEDDLSIEKKYVGWVEKLVSILKTLYIGTMLTKRQTNICKICETAALCFCKLLAS
ncbi:putative papain-like cysteine peptidase superfamily [Helianthus anomalus]